MSRRPSKYPTELEYAVLTVLWRAGAATVRQVRDALADERDLAYTTVMTTLSTMYRKGYVTRSKDGLGYVYRPKLTEDTTAGKMLQDVVRRAFSGSTTAVVQHLIETSDLDTKELRALRRLIDRKANERSERGPEDVA